MEDATNRVNKSCDGLEDEPLGVHLQGVLVRSLDAVEHLLPVAVHRGILQRQRREKLATERWRGTELVSGQRPARYLNVISLPGSANLDGQIPQHHPAVQVGEYGVSEAGRQRGQDVHLCCAVRDGGRVNEAMMRDFTLSSGRSPGRPSSRERGRKRPHAQTNRSSRDISRDRMPGDVYV